MFNYHVYNRCFNKISVGLRDRNYKVGFIESSFRATLKQNDFLWAIGYYRF